MNPFKEYNFTNEHINESNSTTLSGWHFKKLNPSDPRMYPSLAQFMYRKGKGFLPMIREKIDDVIDEVRDRMELPFDELYH